MLFMFCRKIFFSVFGLLITNRTRGTSWILYNSATIFLYIFFGYKYSLNITVSCHLLSCKLKHGFFSMLFNLRLALKNN